MKKRETERGRKKQKAEKAKKKPDQKGMIAQFNSLCKRVLTSSSRVCANIMQLALESNSTETYEEW